VTRSLTSVTYLLMLLLSTPALAGASSTGPGEKPRPKAQPSETATRGEAGAPTSPEASADSTAAPDKTANAASAQADDPDLDVNLAQPDFMLAALPTTLRLPRHQMTFRLTHRFNQPLQDSGVGDLFGMDSGALIGFEFRYGLFSGAQVGFYRTSDRTIQFFTQYDVAKQGGRLPFGVAAYGSVEGTNNFKDSYSPGIGAIVSREIGTRAAVYAEPFWANNTNTQPAEIVDHNSTAILGLGIRLRVLKSTYVVAEVAPRIGGYKPGSAHAAFGIEKRAGGHLFQLTFANNPGTTLANVARGGPSGNNWYLGFNLARKFY
jgi:hypothetical protein